MTPPSFVAQAYEPQTDPDEMYAEHLSIFFLGHNFYNTFTLGNDHAEGIHG